MGGGKQGPDLDVLEPVPRSVLHCLLTAQAMGPNTQTPATTAFLTMMDQTLSNWDRINTSFLTLLWSRVLSQLGNVTKAQSPSHPSWEGLDTLSLGQLRIRCGVCFCSLTSHPGVSSTPETFQLGNSDAGAAFCTADTQGLVLTATPALCGFHALLHTNWHRTHFSLSLLWIDVDLTQDFLSASLV